MRTLSHGSIIGGEQSWHSTTALRALHYHAALPRSARSHQNAPVPPLVPDRVLAQNPLPLSSPRPSARCRGPRSTVCRLCSPPIVKPCTTTLRQAGTTPDYLTFPPSCLPS